MKVKKNKEKELNPFELHINNKKFTILGRKSKNEVGKPGIARSKSIQKVYEFLCQNLFRLYLCINFREKNHYCLSTNLKTNRINSWIVESVKKIKQ